MAKLPKDNNTLKRFGVLLSPHDSGSIGPDLGKYSKHLENMVKPDSIINEVDTKKIKGIKRLKGNEDELLKQELEQLKEQHNELNRKASIYLAQIEESEKKLKRSSELFKELTEEKSKLEARIKDLIDEGAKTKTEKEAAEQHLEELKNQLLEQERTSKLQTSALQDELINSVVKYESKLSDASNKLDDTTRKLFIIASALGVSLGGNIYYMFRGSPNKNVPKNDLENKKLTKAELERELKGV